MSLVSSIQFKDIHERAYKNTLVNSIKTARKIDNQK